MAPDSRVDHGQVDGSFREVGKRFMDQQSRLDNRPCSDLMSDVDYPGRRIDGEDHAFHHGHIGVGKAEIRGESDDSRRLHAQSSKSLGRISPDFPSSTISIIPELGVSSRLISATTAPASLASRARDAAGWTKAEVPITSITWQDRAASIARVSKARSRVSPNHTTWGRNSPPHF